MEERLQGNPVSEGIAYAKSYIYIPGTLTKAPDFFPKGQEEEKYREFRESCEKADSELVTLYNGMCKEDPDKAKIFSAHRELLQDEEILDEIDDLILGRMREYGLSLKEKVRSVRCIQNLQNCWPVWRIR